MCLLYFHSTYKILFAVHLKHSSFVPSADVKPMPNDLVCNVLAVNVCSLAVWATISMNRKDKIVQYDTDYIALYAIVIETCGSSFNILL